MNLSKQLPMRVKQIENTTQQIKSIWQQQSAQKKWLFGLVTIAATGLVLSANRKRLSPGTGFMQGLLSAFMLVFRVNGIALSCVNEKVNT